jgi:hypothetical protein
MDSWGGRSRIGGLKGKPRGRAVQTGQDFEGLRHLLLLVILQAACAQVWLFSAIFTGKGALRCLSTDSPASPSQLRDEPPVAAAAVGDDVGITPRKPGDRNVESG